MKTQQIGTSPLIGSRIALGCMRLSENRKEAMTSVRTALECGINFFDHADIYGRGKREETFSEIWSEIPGLRDKIIVQSKCGIRFAGDTGPNAPQRFDFSYEHIIESVEASLRRLKTDYLDVLLLHRPDPLVEPEEVARAFSKLHVAGKVRFFGVSNHTPAQMELLRRYVDQPLVANQLQISLLHSNLLDEGIQANQDNPSNPIRGEGIMEYCRLHDITIQAWSPLAAGIAAGKVVEKQDERTAQLAALVAEMAEEKNVSREAIVIAWLLRHPAHIQPIIGTMNPERIKGCCQADDLELSREEWYRLFIAGRGYRLP